MRRVQDEGGLIIRAKAGMNPQVVEAFREDGLRLRALRNKPLKAIHAKLPKRQRVELVVEWQVEERPLRLRLLISWNRQTKDLLPGDQPPGAALSPRYDLSRLQMALASRVTV